MTPTPHTYKTSPDTALELNTWFLPLTRHGCSFFLSKWQATHTHTHTHTHLHIKTFTRQCQPGNILHRWQNTPTFTGPKYFVLCRLWNFWYFYWTDLFFTSYCLRTHTFCIDGLNCSTYWVHSHHLCSLFPRHRWRIPRHGDVVRWRVPGTGVAGVPVQPGNDTPGEQANCRDHWLVHSYRKHTHRLVTVRWYGTLLSITIMFRYIQWLI